MKKIFIAMLITALCLAFAACGETGDTEETTAAAESETAAAETEAVTETDAEADAEGDEELSGYQTIQMGNVEMDIPASWEINSRAGSEMTHVYKTEDESVEFQIEAMQADADVDDAVLGEMTQEYAEECGFGEIGYYDTTIGGSIPGKIIPIDATQHPDGVYQRIYTLGKDKTVVAISFIQDSDDFTEMNKALDTVHFLF